jgi:hypothetical protein
MFSCCISAILNNKVVSQKCIMFGMMGAMANLSLQKLDTLFLIPFLIVSKELPTCCEMIWNFFAIGHGKGKVDGTELKLY